MNRTRNRSRLVSHIHLCLIIGVLPLAACAIDEQESAVESLNVVEDWFCVGSTSHSGPDANGLIVWTFTTQNNSTRNHRHSPVYGSVFNPNGGVLTCTGDSSVDFNLCSIPVTLNSGYNSAAGEHRCCEKRTFSQECTDTFFTSDAL